MQSHSRVRAGVRVGASAMARDDAAECGADCAPMDAPHRRRLTRSMRANEREVAFVDAHEVFRALAFETTSRTARGELGMSNVCLERQRERWDCGVACACMCARAAARKAGAGKESQSFELAMMTRACGTKSVWTIDLAYVLRAFGVVSVMFTSFLGVNLQYATASFYREEILRDVRRVERLFASARERGVDVRLGRMSKHTVAELVGSGRVACVALVDKSLLYTASDSEDDVDHASEGRRPHFVGHYVVVCGIVDAERFVIRDPARDDDASTLISARAFDAARRAFGTDDDLIFVNLERFDAEQCRRAMALYASPAA